MARVFVSHASEDLALACEMHQWLTETGHEVFLDRDVRDGIALGELWRQRLVERLRWADAVVCVVTSAYLASTWCTAEVVATQSRGGRLLPLRVEPGLVHPLLTEVQCSDVTGDPVAARSAVAEALRRIDAAGGTGWPDDRPPFPGLRPFDIDWHRVFFGRTEETKHLVELLRSAAGGTTLLVVGPSGCGKSSLIRAGLLPVMADEPGWRTLAPILPGADPVRALARELAAVARRIGLGWTVEQVYQQLTDSGLTGLADELLLVDPSGPQQHLLMVIDQVEELLTQSPPAQRDRFAQLLRPALSGPVHVVGTLRPEFLDQLLSDPGLASLSTTIYPLRSLRREALRAVIEKPAGLAGIELDEGLADRLVDDTDSGDALPLLAFTLAQLAAGITRGGCLSGVRYDQLGGVQGALMRHADAALAEAVNAGGRSREEVIAGLLRLVTVDEQGRPTRWRIPRADLPTPVVTELDAFVTRRLLTTDTTNDTVVIGVAHEAFLSAWPPLAQAIAENASALRTRRAVEQAATQWHDNGYPHQRLWSGGQLAAAVTDTGARIGAGNASPSGRHSPSRWLPRHRRVLVTDRVDISPIARDFLHTSIRHDRSRRRRAITVLSVLLCGALLAAGIAVSQQHTAQEQLRVATARLLITRADGLTGSDLLTAVKLSLAADRIDPSGETHASLVTNLTTSRYSGILTGHTSGVVSVAFAPDGHTLATSSDDATVRLWDLTDRTRPSPLGPPLTGHTDRVVSVAFAPDGHTLATSSDDATVRLWDLTDRTRPSPLGPPLTGHTDRVVSVAFAPDGHTLATSSWDKTVRLWDLTDRTRPSPLGAPLTDHVGPVVSVAFAPDGHTLATASYDRSVRLWDLTDRTRPSPLGAPLTGHTSRLFSVAFAPDGHTLATASYDRSVRLWDLTDRTRPSPLGAPLTGHTDTVNSVAFAPDGHTLATASDDATVRLWDLTDRARPSPLGPPLTGHTSVVYSVVFAPDGHTLATSSWDKTVRLWDLTDRTRPSPLGPPLTAHTSGVFSVAFAPDGHTLATASYDRSVQLWDLTDRARPSPLGPPLTGHTNTVGSVVFAPDGHTLATASDDATVRLWDLTDRTRPSPLGPPLTGHTKIVFSVAFAPDGHTLATASDDATVRLWDLTDRTRPSPLGPPLTAHPSGVFSVAFAPDGHTLATASADQTVRLWDLTDRTRSSPLGPPLTGHTSSVTSVAFAPDGHTLATASDDRTVRLWDLTDRARPSPLGSPLTGHTSTVTSVAFAPDGHTLATASYDRTVRLWDLTGLNDLFGHAVERACSFTGGGLDFAEWTRYIPELPYQNTCPS